MVKRKLLIPAGLFAAGLILLIIGISAGENRSIHGKGSVICMECIGIDGRVRSAR